MEHIITVMSYDQLEETIRNLDLYSRIYMGQYDEMLYRITGRIVFSSTDAILHRKLCQLRDVFIPSLKNQTMNSSLGIWGTYTPKVAMRAYDIQQCLRYQKAYHRSNGSSGYTVDFRPPYVNGDWNVDFNTKRRYHEMLEQQGIYPDFRPGYVQQYVWACPVIISRFGSDKVDIEWSEEVRKIVADAEQAAIFTKEHKFVDIFKLLYPDVNVNLYEKLASDLTEYFDGYVLD